MGLANMFLRRRSFRMVFRVDHDDFLGIAFGLISNLNSSWYVNVPFAVLAWVINVTLSVMNSEAVILDRTSWVAAIVVASESASPCGESLDVFHLRLVWLGVVVGVRL